jgi:hypothetical protein
MNVDICTHHLRVPCRVGHPGDFSEEVVADSVASTQSSVPAAPAFQIVFGGEVFTELQRK